MAEAALKDLEGMVKRDAQKRLQTMTAERLGQAGAALGTAIWPNQRVKALQAQAR